MHSLLLVLYFSVSRVSAQVFNGAGLQGGVNEASQIQGPTQGSLRQVILSLFHQALGFLAIAAVVMIVIAGFTFVLSAGSDTAKDRAKKMIQYTVIGLLIVLFARSLVGFFMNGLP